FSGLIAKLADERYETLGDELCVYINIDGIPIYNSSSVEFWPILLYCKNFRNSAVTIVAFFCGRGKPTPLIDFLKPFVNECQALIAEGINFKNKHFKIKLEAFYCDAPARAYLKQIVGHNGKEACERCDIVSIYSREDKKRYYPTNSNAKLRSDEDFLNISSDHVSGQSPLLELDVGLVSNFVLDPMHLIYLGIMKRLINYWLEGKRQFKLSKAATADINKNLHSFKVHIIPTEFGRKIRTFNDVKRWKAVEFRFFLLYSGILAMRSSLDSVKYKHFLLLHVGIFLRLSSI
ncbi:hypothetical protein NQ314_012749, partial [Rhamnusium bicolor]